MSERAPDVARLFRPRSIAIVGVSPERDSPGFNLLGNLERFGFAGAIHLVSRSRSELGGRPCVPTIDALPDGVDLALLMLPRAAIEESVAACARRGVGAAIIFAAGFGEAGGEWAAAQDRFSALARAAGLALCGPNCLGIMNYVDGVPLTFSPQARADQPGPPTIAIVGQSGGLATILRNALWGRGLGATYTVSTGNEAVLNLEDYIDYIVADEPTRVICAFAEEIRQPERFLMLASRARDRGKPIVLLHPGRSDAARESAASHTGALAGNWAMIQTLAAHAGAVMAQSLEELIDVTELIVRFPHLPAAGPAVLTDSGAFKGMTLDLCEELGLDLPPLSPELADTLRRELPEFVGPSNPLDVTAQAILHLDLYTRTLGPLIADPSFGSILLAVIVTGGGDFPLTKARASLRPVIGTGKPAIFGLLGDDADLPPTLIAEAREGGVPFFRSPERALRALARVTLHARASRRGRIEPAPGPVPPLPMSGVVPEYASKVYLAALGIPVPPGRLARDLPAAQEAAAAIGFPVALKLQSTQLSHKSDIGGVALNVSARGLPAAWRKLETIARRRKLALDGILVEAMSRPGLETIVGARRDARWGPVLLVGLGGIWAEAVNDVRLLPSDLEESEIAAEIGRLKGAKLFGPLRGAPARDVAALAAIVAKVGALMRANHAIREIDLNPVTLLAAGEGAIALDALIVAE